MAPLFDNERSLWSGLPLREIGRPVNGKPFHEKPERQLKLAEGATFPCMPEADKVRDAVLFAFAEAGVPEEREEKTARPRAGASISSCAGQLPCPCSGPGAGLARNLRNFLVS